MAINCSLIQVGFVDLFEVGDPFVRGDFLVSGNQPHKLLFTIQM
jgi:hypothetical protein